MTPEEARKLVASAERYADDDKRAVLAEIVDAGELADALLTVANLRCEYDYEVAFGDEWTPQGYSFATLEYARRFVASRRRKSPARIVRRLVSKPEVVE